MNKSTVAGDWKMMKGKLKQKWAKLTDDDLGMIEGEREELSGILEKRYGMAKDQAARQCKDFYKECGCD